MDDFKTDNQDKSNLVGDAEEIIRLKDEVIELKVKAKAWDDLEALTKHLDGRITITPNAGSYWHKFIIEKMHDNPLFSSREFNIEAVSNALASIKGES